MPTTKNKPTEGARTFSVLAPLGKATMKSVQIDPKERFTRKRKALKIAKRTLKLLITELGYVAPRRGQLDGTGLEQVGELTLYWGDRDGRHMHMTFKSIMDKNRKRHPNPQHIPFERVMIKATALRPKLNPSLPNEKEIILDPKALIFTGKTPVTRVKKFHAQLVAGLLT